MGPGPLHSGVERAKLARLSQQGLYLSIRPLQHTEQEFTLFTLESQSTPYTYIVALELNPNLGNHKNQPTHPTSASDPRIRQKPITNPITIHHPHYHNVRNTIPPNPLPPIPLHPNPLLPTPQAQHHPSTVDHVPDAQHPRRVAKHRTKPIQQPATDLQHPNRANRPTHAKPPIPNPSALQRVRLSLNNTNLSKPIPHPHPNTHLAVLPNPPETKVRSTLRFYDCEPASGCGGSGARENTEDVP